jgi:AraC-like DNA-binding protein
MLGTLTDMCDRLKMDPVSALLDGPHAQRAFLLKAVFDGTWSISIEDRAPLTLVVMARGSATFTGSGEPEDVTAGDVVVVRGPTRYTFADSATTPVGIRILPGQVCVDPQGAILPEEMDLGVRTWGNTRAEDATVMLIGTYGRETSVGALLLSRLPTDVVFRQLDSPLTDVLAAELTRDEPGQAAVLDRLLDLLTVTVLRETLASSPARPTDELMATVLRAIHEHPERPWTVESLASCAGLSRAALARRFTQQFGEPPLTHLTRWRLALAADLLAGSELTLSNIAPRVGYANAFALSVAFKRVHGTSPAYYRARHSACGARPCGVGA